MGCGRRLDMGIIQRADGLRLTHTFRVNRVRLAIHCKIGDVHVRTLRSGGTIAIDKVYGKLHDP